MFIKIACHSNPMIYHRSNWRFYTKHFIITKCKIGFYERNALSGNNNICWLVKLYSKGRYIVVTCTIDFIIKI